MKPPAEFKVLRVRECDASTDSAEKPERVFEYWQANTRLDRPATAKEAIQAAHLDWNVTKTPVYATVGGARIVVPDTFAVIRQDPLHSPVLGVVSKDYTPLQNTEAFAFFDPIVGENAAIYHTAGALGQGERIWLLAKLPRQLRIVGDDVADKYLLLANSHDGKGSVQVKFTSVRVVCRNTLTSPSEVLNRSASCTLRT